MKRTILCCMLCALMLIFCGCMREQEAEQPPAYNALFTEPPAAPDAPEESPFADDGDYYVFRSTFYEYMKAAKNVLHGEPAERVYSNDVYFHLDDDALRAYGTCIIREDPEIEEFSEPLAEYPREAGERALQRLYGEIANRWGIEYTGPHLSAEGFAGEDWFVLKTRDDSIQDIQFSCIFRFDGSEWYEFGENSEQYYPLFGACIVDENTGFLSYFSKFLDEPEGSYRKLYLYRTEDGGKTWLDMGLELPEEYGMAYPGYASSPVFEGEHGVMFVKAFDYDSQKEEDRQFRIRYETFDGGRTWELRGDGEG